METSLLLITKGGARRTICPWVGLASNPSSINFTQKFQAISGWSWKEDQGLKQAFAAGEMEDGEGIYQILQAFLEKASHVCGILGKVFVQNNLDGFAGYRTGKGISPKG